MDAIENDIATAARLIAAADALVIAAGAGMGVDSGLPDFRGERGFWQAYPALGRAGIDFRAAASAPSFASHPERAWGFYGHRLNLYRRTVPHAGFDLLRAWGDAMPQGYTVFTSNVDGQFERAGFEPDAIVECHGSIHHLQCQGSCPELLWSAAAVQPQVDEERCVLTSPLPRCPGCGRVARPNILMFDDWHWVQERSAGQARRQANWMRGLGRAAVIELGAGSDIPTVRHFSERMAERHGTLIRINPREPEVERGRGVGLALGALDALRRIARLL